MGTALTAGGTEAKRSRRTTQRDGQSSEGAKRHGGPLGRTERRRREEAKQNRYFTERRISCLTKTVESSNATTKRFVLPYWNSCLCVSGLLKSYRNSITKTAPWSSVQGHNSHWMSIWAPDALPKTPHEVSLLPKRPLASPVPPQYKHSPSVPRVLIDVGRVSGTTGTLTNSFHKYDIGKPGARVGLLNVETRVINTCEY